MKIYTKTGDKGQTSLIGGTRVRKSHLRIESYGTVDELNSWIGLVRDLEVNLQRKAILVEIQDRLFTIGSHLATDPGKRGMKLPGFSIQDVENLELAMDEMNETLPPLRVFVLPGGHTSVSYCHIARCVCRRAERLVIKLDQEAAVEELIITYLNRLSDYLFVLSRQVAQDLKAPETPWKPRM